MINKVSSIYTVLNFHNIVCVCVCVYYMCTCMYRVHELVDLAHKELGGAQSTSAKPQTGAKGSGEPQPTPKDKPKPKPETDEFKDPDKNIDVCCTGCNNIARNIGGH